MGKNTVIKLIVAQAACQNCGFKRLLYFLPENSYGERIVSTKDGRYCAYTNVKEDSILSEIEKYCNEILTDKNAIVPQKKIDRIVSNVYGITCDDLYGRKVDTSRSWLCSNCHQGELKEDQDFGEKLQNVEVTNISHNVWDKLSQNEKRKKIMEELQRQDYIK